MAAPGQRVGRAVLELLTDKSQYSAGLQQAQGELTGFSGRAQTTYRNLAQGMAAAGKEASASARMIASMSAAGRQALAEQQRVANGFLNTGAQLMKATRENAKPVSEMAKAMSSANANAQASARMIASMGAAGRQAAEGLNRVNPVLRAMNSAASAVKGSVGQMVAGFTGANLATTVIMRLGDAMRQVVADGQQLTGVTRAFDRLTASIGESRDVMLDAARVGTKGLVKDLDLMLATNKAMLLGLPVTSQEMGKLAQTATSLGRAMGQDATKSLDDLITALGRSSPLILDNLGLTVKLGEANEAYARKLGKTSDELTEAERKTAFYNAAMAAAEKKVAELGDTHLTASEQIARLGVQLKNNLAETVKNTNESGLLSDAIGLIADAYARASKNARDFAEINRRRVESKGQQDIRSIEELELVRETERQIEQMKKKLASPLPSPGLGSLNLGGTTRTLEQDIRRLETATGVYTARLGRIREELAKLLPEERKQIAAAQALGVSNEDLEKQYHLTEGALRVLNDQTRAGTRAANEAASAAKKYADLLGADERAKAADLAKALGTGELQLAKMTVDAQQKIVEALFEGAQWWRAIGEVVPASVQKQIDAVVAMGVLPAEIRKVNQAYAEFLATGRDAENEFQSRRVEKDREVLQAQIDSSQRRGEAEREAAATSADIEFARAEFAIEQAKRTGASWQQIDAMEKALADARLQRTIDQAEQEFRIRTAGIDRTTAFGEAEYQALRRAHDLAIQGMLETHQRAELVRRQELQRTHSLWRRMLDEMRIADRLIEAATSNLFSTFLSKPDDSQVKALRKTADEARAAYEEISGAAGKAAQATATAHQKMLDAQRAFDEAKVRKAPAEELQRLSALMVQSRMAYERIATDGKSSAKEIQDAFDRMREAEEAANVQAASRWKSYWDGLKRTFTSILDDMLSYFAKQFIGGLMRSLAGSRLGQAFGGFLGGAGGGFGGGAGGVGGLFGQGGGIAMSAASSGLFAAGGSSAGLASGAAINAQTAALAGGGGGMGALGAFFTNPFTIGAAAGAALGLAIWKKGLFRGGEEALKVSPRRDQAASQFGDPANKGVGGADHNLAALLTRHGAGFGGGSLFQNWQKADTVKKWESAQAAVVAFLGKVGVRMKSYLHGGFVPPGVVQPAVLHGGRRGELIVPLDRVQTSAPAPAAVAPTIMHFSFEIHAHDTIDFKRVIRNEVFPEIIQGITLNIGGLGTAVRGT